MIDFPRSTFTWISHPWQADPHYTYAGGYVGGLGQVRHIRFNLEAKCDIHDEASGQVTELFVGAPCRTEYTIPKRNLFQIPGDEFRLAFSHTHQIPIAKRPSQETEAVSAVKLSAAFQDHLIRLRHFQTTTELTKAAPIVEATKVVMKAENI